MLPSVERHFLVNLVADDREIRLLHDRSDLFHLAPGEHDSGGIAGGVQDEDTRLRPDRAAQQANVRPEPGRRRKRGDDRDAVGETDDRRIAHPVGSGNDDLIPRVEYRTERIEYRLLRPGGNQDLVRREMQVIVRGEFVDDRADELRGSLVRCVMREVGLDRPEGGLLDMRRCREVGFPGRQADDVHAGFLQEAGFLREEERLRLLQVSDFCGEVTHRRLQSPTFLRSRRRTPGGTKSETSPPRRPTSLTIVEFR